MDSWNEPISFAPDGTPNDALSKAEGMKEKLKKAPLQVNNDGSVTPLNQDGSPLDGSPYERPEMSGESEGWKLKDKNAFNGKYDDVMDLDDVDSPSPLKGLAKGFMKGYSGNLTVKKPNSLTTLGKLVVEKFEPNGGVSSFKVYEQGEIQNLEVTQDDPQFTTEDGYFAVGSSHNVYTITTAKGIDKYKVPPFKLTYHQPVEEKTPDAEWANSDAKQIIDAIKTAKKSFETAQPVMDTAAAHAFKAMNFANIYGASAQKQAEIYEKYLQSKNVIHFSAVPMEPVDPSEDGDDYWSPDEEIEPELL